MEKPRIMIVEDERMLSKSLERHLSDAGYEVAAVAKTGERAVKEARSTKPGLILMDIKLAGKMDGIQAAREIQSFHNAAIVYLTAHGEEELFQNAKLTGPYAYLTKPVSMHQLDRTIETALYKHEMESRLRDSEERFRAIFESAEDSIQVRNSFLQYTMVNPAAETLMNRSASEIIGRTDEELFDSETSAALREVDLRVLDGQTVEQEYELQIGGKRVMLFSRKVPLRNVHGDVVGICDISRDITSRRHFGEIAEPGDTDFSSGKMRKTLSLARVAAKRAAVVLLTGETGSGKDYLARYIHSHSPRSGGPFRSVNCAAIPKDIAESELFGHEPGAFTGATGARGLLELAEGGTLLLNEIGELSLPIQAKLLSFLDERSFTRVGGRKPIKVNARLVAATNKDLKEELDQGRFRADLFHRINVFAIHVPSLRERIEDIPILAQSILTELAKELGLDEVPRLDADTTDRLCRYQWPGNVRELKNVLERALIVSGGNSFSIGQFMPDLLSSRSWSYSVEFPETGSMDQVMDDLSRQLIQEALRRSGGNQTCAAKSLRLSRAALWRRTRKLGILE